MAIEQAITSQGINVFTEHIPGMETANVEVYVGVGSIHEEPRETGLAHVLEHAVHLQTARFPEKKDLIEYRGVHGMWANAHTHYLHTAFKAAGPEIEPMFVQLGETVTRPAFPDEPIRAEMEVVRQEVRNRWDNHSLTNYLAGDFMLFGGPYGRDIAGHVEHIDFTPEEVRAFYQSYYNSHNTKVMAIGNITLEQAVALTEKHFSKVSGGREPRRQPVGTWLVQDTRSGLILDAKSTSVSRQVAMTSLEFNAVVAEEDLYDVAAGAIGTYALYHLRNERGISYSASFDAETYNAQGKIALRTSAAAENVAKVEEAFDHIVTRDVSEYTDGEVQAEIGKFRGRVLRDMDSLEKRIKAQETHIRVFGRPQNMAVRAEKLRNVTTREIREKMEDLLGIFEAAPKLTHISGRKEAVGDVDKIVQLKDII